MHAHAATVVATINGKAVTDTDVTVTKPTQISRVIVLQFDKNNEYK